MKKLLSILLAILCCASVIAFTVSCGADTEKDPSPSDAVTEEPSETSGDTSKTEAPEDTSTPEDTSKPEDPEIAPDISDYHKIVVEIAKAYDRQGGQIPYDQYYSRRSLYSSPEDATAQRTIFLDCSSFVNSCYREGFGANVLPYEPGELSPNTLNFDNYAKNNQGKSDVIGYWIPSQYPTAEDKQAVVDYIYGNLQIGDILTYRHGKTESTKGHTYIYIGNNTFMHCAGAGSYVVNSSDPSLSHDSNANETEGTIATISADTIFKKTTHNRYLFKATDSDTVYSFGIIRPFARGLKPTSETLCRMKIAGLSMEKTSSICENASVFRGIRLTYTVTMENTGGALSGVTVTDTLPLGTAFVSGSAGVTESNGSISWVGDVPAGATVSVSYTVEISDDAGSLIVSDETYVSGVKLGCITHSVSSLSATQLYKIAQTATAFTESGQRFDNGLDMVKAVYGTHAIELFSADTASAVLDQLIDKEHLTHHTDTELSDMLAPNLYGGLSIMYGWYYFESENDKTRLPKEDHLHVGDVILADWGGGSTVYLYVGDHTLITVEDGVCKKLTIKDDIFVEGENIIISLLGYDRYAVIRPSMRNLSSASVVSLSITKQPDKLSYDNGEPFDRTGMIVTATLSDQTQMTVTSYLVSHEILTPDVTLVTVSFGGKTATVSVTVSSKQYAYSVTDVSTLDVGTTVYVEGIVVGVAHEGLSNDKELLIKDLNADTVIAVRNTGGTLDNTFGYQLGDVILFKATVKSDTSSSTCYTLKKYLAFSSENGSVSKTIVSRGNAISYSLDNVVEIDSWEDLQEFFVKETNTPYTYLKISGGFFLRLHQSSDTDNYRFHMNADATGLDDTTSDGIVLTFRDDVMSENLGENWKDYLSFEETSEYPGTFVDKEIYVLYIGGNKTYYQLVILDEDWISE